MQCDFSDIGLCRLSHICLKTDSGALKATAYGAITREDAETADGENGRTTARAQGHAAPAPGVVSESVIGRGRGVCLYGGVYRR